ncbi:hypothetical protein Q7P37_006029 [Cladosporium fusiforme]
MPSPMRRSARAAPSVPTTASSSSQPSLRRDRSTRGSISHPKSTTPQLRSSEEMSEPPRRSKRAHPAAEPEVLSAAQDADEEAAEDEEEVTRCLCGQQEYPGPPLSEAYGASEAQADDAGGLFIQCDGCSVWQHGGCVGIFDESQSPDKYYCEECRPKQHDVQVDTRGERASAKEALNRQRYSHYLPVTSKLRRASFGSKSDEKARKERMEISRGSIDPVSGKRRGTIRSREHDEEAEQIQRAIEESAREAGRRGGKRSRDESSEDAKQESKRARRISESGPSGSRSAVIEDESDEDIEGGTFSGRSKKAKADAVMTARQSEQRDKETERERARAEAAGRRQARAGRRRQDDEPEDTPKLNSTSHASPPPSSQPDSPPPATQEKPTQKKPVGRKVKRLGNNQYTKHRGEAPTSAGVSSPHSKKRANNSHTSSGDENALANGDGTSTPDAPTTNGNGNGNGTSNGTGRGGGRWGKGKKAALANGLKGNNNMHNLPVEPAERTIPNMARNLDAMMNFIHRAQTDLATDRARLGSERSPPGEGRDAMELADELSRGIRDWQGRFNGEVVGEAVST